MFSQNIQHLKLKWQHHFFLSLFSSTNLGRNRYCCTMIISWVNDLNCSVELTFREEADNRCTLSHVCSPLCWMPFSQLPLAEPLFLLIHLGQDVFRYILRTRDTEKTMRAKNDADGTLYQLLFSVIVSVVRDK